MSTFILILTTAMVIPADGPTQVTGELERRLDLSGKWEGTLRTKESESCRVRIDPKAIRIESNQGSIGFPTTNIIDQGSGKLLLKGRRCLYRQADDLLVICLGDLNRRPSSIGADYGALIILHRAKSHK